MDMKRVSGFFVWIILTVFVVNDAFADYKVTIYSPEGRPVSEIIVRNEFSSSQIVAANNETDNWISFLQLNAIRIGNSSRRYNCHGYTYLRSEDLGTYWMNWPERDKYINDQNWANDGQRSYLSASETQASHTNYTHEDHSARKIQNSYPVPISGGRNYVAKWGEAGLVQHAKNHDVYYEKQNLGHNFRRLKTTHSGTLTSHPKTWIGAGGINHTITDNITIPSGGSLMIKGGAIVSFPSNKGLIAHGQLNTQGTSSKPAVLKPTGSSWTGVHLHGAGSSLSHAHIKDAVNGVSVFNTSNISLANLKVSGSNSYGIHIVNSSGVTVSHTTLENNSLRGISLDGNTNGNWPGNWIAQHQDGMRVLGGATLSNLNSSNVTGNWNGAVVREASTLTAASNNFYNNGGRHVVSIEGSTVNAQRNWWGQAPPDPGKFQVDGTSSINYSNWSTSGPSKALPSPAGKLCGIFNR